MKNNLRNHNLGFLRIGAKRQLKRALESFWSKKTGEAQLLETAKVIRAENWQTQKAAGLDFIPSNDFSPYDQTRPPHSPAPFDARPVSGAAR